MKTLTCNFFIHPKYLQDIGAGVPVFLFVWVKTVTGDSREIKLVPGTVHLFIQVKMVTVDSCHLFKNLQYRNTDWYFERFSGQCLLIWGIRQKSVFFLVSLNEGVTWPDRINQ